MVRRLLIVGLIGCLFAALAGTFIAVLSISRQTTEVDRAITERFEAAIVTYQALNAATPDTRVEHSEALQEHFAGEALSRAQADLEGVLARRTPTIAITSTGADSFDYRSARRRGTTANVRASAIVWSHKVQQIDGTDHKTKTADTLNFEAELTQIDGDWMVTSLSTEPAGTP